MNYELHSVPSNSLDVLIEVSQQSTMVLKSAIFDAAVGSRKP